MKSYHNPKSFQGPKDFLDLSQKYQQSIQLQQALLIDNDSSKSINRNSIAQQIRRNHQKNKRRDVQLQLSRRSIVPQQSVAQQTVYQLQLKQLRALSNKSHGMIQKSRRVEAGLAKWQEIVHNNQQELRERLYNQSSIVLDKSGNLNIYHGTLQPVSISKGIISLQKNKNTHQTLFIDKQFNPQATLNRYNSPKALPNHKGPTILRHRKSGLACVNKAESNTRLQTINTRVNAVDLHMGKRQNNIECLLLLREKEARINEARFMKQYLLIKTKQRIADRSQSCHKVNADNLQLLKEDQRQRKQLLQKRLMIDRSQKCKQQKQKGKKSSKMNKHSLPLINTHKNSHLVYENTINHDLDSIEIDAQEQNDFFKQTINHLDSLHRNKN